MKAHLSIDGMHCDHCLRAVRGALENQAGVTVDALQMGAADVTFDPSRVTVDAIVDAIGDEGYVATASRVG
jgi:copper chaperone